MNKLKTVKKVKLDHCLDIIEQGFARFQDHRAVKVISLKDMLMSSLAVFNLKCESLLSFEDLMSPESELRKKNLRAMYRIEKLPSDTQLRAVLDWVPTDQYRRIFNDLFFFIQRNKLLEEFEFMRIEKSPYYLHSVDGTGYYRSEKVICNSCQVSEHINADGVATLRFGHNMLAGSIVHPDKRCVIPVMPEVIQKQDGFSKNDCEQNAFKRYLKNLKKDHPKLKLILTLDALYATSPVIRLIREGGYEYLITVKASKSLLFNQLSKEGVSYTHTKYSGEKIIKTHTYSYKYLNNARLHQDKETVYVNVLKVTEEIEWIDKDQNLKRTSKTFSYITDICITDRNVHKLATGGRARWKIENETFNTLKNRGYNLEHNYGHGKNYLSSNFIMSMFLAFYIDQIQMLSCRVFNKLKNASGSWRRVWDRILSGFDWIELTSWTEYYAIWDKKIIDSS